MCFVCFTNKVILMEKGSVLEDESVGNQYRHPEVNIADKVYNKLIASQ